VSPGGILITNVPLISGMQLQRCTPWQGPALHLASCGCCMRHLRLQRVCTREAQPCGTSLTGAGLRTTCMGCILLALDDPASITNIGWTQTPTPPNQRPERIHPTQTGPVLQWQDLEGCSCCLVGPQPALLAGKMGCAVHTGPRSLLDMPSATAVSCIDLGCLQRHMRC
jgi:hypothetical protein